LARTIYYHAVKDGPWCGTCGSFSNFNERDRLVCGICGRNSNYQKSCLSSFHGLEWKCSGIRSFFVPDDGEQIEVNDSLLILAGGLRHEFTAGFMSLNLQNAILNDLYRAVPLPIFSSLHLAHYSTAPAPVVSPTIGGTEPTDPAYARQPIAVNGTIFGAASGGQIATVPNIPAAAYAAATLAQGNRTHWGLHDAATAGNFQIGGLFATPKTVDIGDPFVVDRITISLDVP
jgi:hypothetical protein